MISRIVASLRSKLDYAQEIKRNVISLSKRKTSIGLMGVGTVTIYFTYLYEKDDDYLVEEFPRRLPVTLYRILPLREFSRMFGYFASKEIPEQLRGVLLGSYVRLTGVDLSDAKITDINEYKTLSELFQRQLRWDSRTIDRECDMVSPCDGTVLHCGHADNGTIEQVKGVNFTLGGFLGKDYPYWRKKFSSVAANNASSAGANKSIRDGRSLFYCILYLAPGDYHRFHSPTECDLEFRRYFPGKLLSVNPILARFLPGLFSVNERAVYFGRWRYGLFSFTAVGATNVGNIRVFSDRDLPTNRNHQSLEVGEPLVLERDIQPLVRLSRGQLFGEFNLGSSIVLVFEAPSTFRFSVKSGDRVRMGLGLGNAQEGNRSPEGHCRQM